MSGAYYNEHDDHAADWLEGLIATGLIPDGLVDRRNIEEVCPSDLDKFTQCHFFAGIGGWPATFRRVGWRDDRPAWTASPPCQPFSTAGLKKGFADPRHLWPVFERLVAERRPAVFFGEQSSNASDWLANVRGRMGWMRGARAASARALSTSAHASPTA
jgi:DNA (cytosine-5)-methyltransferase 1